MITIKNITLQVVNFIQAMISPVDIFSFILYSYLMNYLINDYNFARVA